MASDDASFCHLCGSREQITFEHIPPARCWNDKPTRLIEMMGLSNRYPAAPERRYHRGLGRKSLCRRCNGWTADRYGAAFFEWTIQAAVYADTVSEPRAEGLLFSIEPLRVVKQLLTMALAAADPGIAPVPAYLRRFVLDPSARHLPEEFSVHAYLNPREPKSRAFRDRSKGQLLPLNRMTKQCAAIDTTGRPPLHVFAEIAFPPMGYLYRFGDASGPVPRQAVGMPDISYFGKFRLGERSRIFMDLPVKTPIGPAAGHYLGDD